MRMLLGSAAGRERGDSEVTARGQDATANGLDGAGDRGRSSSRMDEAEKKVAGWMGERKEKKEEESES